MPHLSECQTERSKTVARWLGIAVIAALLQRQRARGDLQLPLETFLLLLTVPLVANLVHTLYLFRANACSRFYKYLTVGLDLVFLSVVIGYSGYNQSPYFYVYFLILVSNCIRYGLLMSIHIAVLVNVLYIIVLWQAPELQTTVIGGEGLKILAFWGVALYGGGVAARMRRQLYEMEAQGETLARLQAELTEIRKDQLPEAPQPAPPVGPPPHLPLLHGETMWLRALAPVGAALAVLAILLTVLAPSVLWFLAYPVLVIGALAALATTAGWLLRYLRL